MAHITKMILVSSPSKPFQYTSKQTVRRQYMIKEYSEEIGALYASASEAAQEDIQGPSSWSKLDTTLFIRNIIGASMKKKGETISDDEDLFEHGLDRYDFRDTKIQ